MDNFCIGVLCELCLVIIRFEVVYVVVEKYVWILRKIKKLNRIFLIKCILLSLMNLYFFVVNWFLKEKKEIFGVIIYYLMFW